ncbi:MAG: DUF1343 domain-containing protein [Bacteroidales bacterium]|nr:DUF1343 domain-containing protein [Bacteroidales bacterium]
MKRLLIGLGCMLLLLFSCSGGSVEEKIICGAERTEKYIDQLEGKRVGIIANHTSMIASVHLVDSLLARGIDIEKIFSPEHGFRGRADAGAHIADGIDKVSGIKVISLYGKNRKPSREQFKDIDILLFDIQDVGARFYTYISTLEYVMETAAEVGLPLIVLDRPNPNGHYIDGPILDTAFRSFVGMQEVPVVHGMTVGEYAKMLIGENWLANGLQCELKVIDCLNYDHSKKYNLPLAPSPNLPNQNSVLLYPSICFFEGTVFSCGRGTEIPFQVYGHPDYLNKNFEFTPMPGKGAANTKLNGELCYGVDLSKAIDSGVVPGYSIELNWLLDAYNNFPEKEKFFNSYFNTLAGTDSLKQQIIDGLSAEEIRLSWQEELNDFKAIREKYLIYE